MGTHPIFESDFDCLTVCRMGIENVKNVIVVLSGKGGVGKSSVSVQIARGFLAQGLSVGMLDVDICGPSIPRMLGVEDQSIHQSDEGLVPVFLHESKFKLISIGFLAEKEEAIIWRGPKKQSMIKQLVTQVAWGDLDLLVIDTPPGTSDEHIALVQTLRDEAEALERTSCVLVTTPQMASIQDVNREINFCIKTNLKMAGIVENMSGFVCPHCSECSDIFNKGTSKVLSEKYKLPFLGNIPIDPNFGFALDNGK